MVDFLVGADPEFFLIDKETGKHVSAYGMIPGTKRDPLPLEGGAAQVDGMALEININPASSFKEFSDNLDNVLSQVRKMIDPRYEFDFSPVAHFGKKYIDAQPEEAKMLGCDPDYNAYTGGANPKPDGARGFRTASGHIHVGWTSYQDITHPDHIEACRMLTKQLDCYLGIPSLIWDRDDIRREMYGEFGAFRPKHYGVEYRVLSNVWMKDVSLRKYVYNQAVYAAEKLVDGLEMYASINAQRIYWTKNIGDIFSLTSHYIHHADPDDYNYLNLITSKSNKNTRPIVERTREQFKSGEYFRHSETGRNIHWDDVSLHEIQEEIVTYWSPALFKYKEKGLSWAEVRVELSKKKEEKVDVKPVSFDPFQHYQAQMLYHLTTPTNPAPAPEGVLAVEEIPYDEEPDPEYDEDEVAQWFDNNTVAQQN